MDHGCIGNIQPSTGQKYGMDKPLSVLYIIYIKQQYTNV